MGFEEVKKQFFELPIESKLELINNLSSNEKIAIGQNLLGGSGLTVILGGNNVVANSTAFQINSSAEEISKTLNELPPEVVAEFLKAIATSIIQRSQNQPPYHHH